MKRVSGFTPHLFTSMFLFRYTNKSVPVRKRGEGFTLIELLVVIAIIGLLSSIVFASIDQSRVKARDALRLSHMGEIQKALNLYFDDNGAWPCTGVSGSNTYIDNQSHCLATTLAPYMSPLPLDPRYGGDGSLSWGLDYQYQVSGGRYFLRTAFEGQPVERTHSYPNGTNCQTPGFPRCAWNGESCVYMIGSSCDVMWVHRGE